MSVLEVRETPSCGRGMFVTQDVPSGADVVSEPPLLLTVARDAAQHYCGQCLRILPQPGHLRCPETGAICFCCEECQRSAEVVPGSPSLAVRQQLVRAQWAKDDVVDAEDAHRMQLLLQIVALQQAAAACDPTSAERMAALLNLVPGREQLNDVAGHKRMQGHLQAACNGQPPLSFPEIAQLVARDAVNAFGIEVPGSDELRGSALYARASMVNHACLPTIARVDHFDSDGPHRTHLQLRTLHALPAGEEALLSYVPLPWPLKERQVQCKDVYEFECCCPRCVCEQIEDTEEARLAAGLEDGLDGSYVHMFLMKYVCTQSDCFGTLVPAAQRDDGLAVCNVCGRGRTLEQFMAELTAGAE